MEQIPFENVLALLISVRDQLMPRAMQDLLWRRKQAGCLVTSDPERMLAWVRGVNSDQYLKAWLHEKASLRQWACLYVAFGNAIRALSRGSEADPAARLLVAELVGCSAAHNVVRLVLRGQIDPDNPEETASE